jgi:WD40 repeat protein
MDNTTRIWNRTTGELIHTFNEDTSSEDFVGLYLYPYATIAQLEVNSNILVSSVVDTIHLWNLSTGKLEFALHFTFTSDCAWQLKELTNSLIASFCTRFDEISETIN